MWFHHIKGNIILQLFKSLSFYNKKNWFILFQLIGHNFYWKMILQKCRNKCFCDVKLQKGGLFKKKKVPFFLSLLKNSIKQIKSLKLNQVVSVSSSIWDSNISQMGWLFEEVPPTAKRLCGN